MKFLIKTETVKDLLQVVSKDSTWPHLCGIMIDTGAMKVATTDGHRIAIRDFNTDCEPPELTQMISDRHVNLKITFSNEKGGFLETLKKRFNKETIKITIDKTNKKVKLEATEYGQDVIASFGVLEIEGEVVEGFEIGVNSEYLESALKRLTDKHQASQYEIGFGTSEEAIHITNKNKTKLEVVMPCAHQKTQNEK